MLPPGSAQAIWMWAMCVGTFLSVTAVSQEKANGNTGMTRCLTQVCPPGVWTLGRGGGAGGLHCWQSSPCFMSLQQMAQPKLQWQQEEECYAERKNKSILLSLKFKYGAPEETRRRGYRKRGHDHSFVRPSLLGTWHVPGPVQVPVMPMCMSHGTALKECLVAGAPWLAKDRW